jgi:hypothetical protein
VRGRPTVQELGTGRTDVGARRQCRALEGRLEGVVVAAGH